MKIRIEAWRRARDSDKTERVTEAIISAAPDEIRHSRVGSES